MSKTELNRGDLIAAAESTKLDNQAISRFYGREWPGADFSLEHSDVFRSYVQLDSSEYERENDYIGMTFEELLSEYEDLVWDIHGAAHQIHDESISVMETLDGPDVEGYPDMDIDLANPIAELQNFFPQIVDTYPDFANVQEAMEKTELEVNKLLGELGI